MNHHSKDINRLLRCHHTDDPAIIKEMIQQYYAAIYRLAGSILYDSDEAKDATQDTFITAMTKLDQYQVGTNFKAWLYAIAVNTCRGYMRKRKRRESLNKVLTTVQALAAHPPSPERSVLQGEMRSQLWDAVDQLSDKHRITVVLRMVHGLTIQEIAQVLETKEKTVYSRLYSAFHKLRQQLDGQIELESISDWCPESK